MRIRYNLRCAKLLVGEVPFINHNQEDGETFFRFELYSTANDPETANDPVKT